MSLALNRVFSLPIEFYSNPAPRRNSPLAPTVAPRPLPRWAKSEVLLKVVCQYWHRCIRADKMSNTSKGLWRTSRRGCRKGGRDLKAFAAHFQAKVPPRTHMTQQVSTDPTGSTQQRRWNARGLRSLVATGTGSYRWSSTPPASRCECPMSKINDRARRPFNINRF